MRAAACSSLAAICDVRTGRRLREVPRCRERDRGSAAASRPCARAAGGGRSVVVGGRPQQGVAEPPAAAVEVDDARRLELVGVEPCPGERLPDLVGVGSLVRQATRSAARRAWPLRLSILKA